MRKDPRRLWRAELAHLEPISGLTPETKDKLSLLCHQISFFSDRIHKVLVIGQDGLRRRHGNDYRMPSPSKDMEVLIRLVSELQDLHEDILYNADLGDKGKPT